MGKEKNVLNGYYLPIQGFSNDIKELISKMLVVDAKKRASTNELLNSDIIQRRINAMMYLKKWKRIPTRIVAVHLIMSLFGILYLFLFQAL